jgi:polysaccharide export outer membrane protein
MLAAALALAGCTALPRSGPDDGVIAKSAVARLDSNDKAGMGYALVEVSEAILPYFQVTSESSLRSGFGGGRGGAPSVPLGIGDVIEVSIFEAGAGGLFIPSDAGSRPGNYITLPRQTVDSTGAVTVPYAGQVQVAGRLPSAVQTEIEGLLANRAIEPQAVITVVERRSNQVAVLGDVNQPGKFEISPSGERVLDIISRAGGVSTPGIETYVTLERRNKQATVLFQDLVKSPAENIYVAPGDTIYLNRERRTYLVFGASGLNGRFDFEESSLTLGEALAKAGGLLDSRADPAQVLLYRTVDRRTLEKMGLDPAKLPAKSAVPTIFRADLRKPGAFFLTQQFAMADKDILYISNADATELIKFLQIVNSISSTAGGVPSDLADGKSAIESLAD